MESLIKYGLADPDTLFSLATFLASLISIFISLKANATSNRALLIETEPFLTVEVVDASQYEWRPDGFHKDGEKVEEIWLRVNNAGKSAATLEAIYRRWLIKNKIDDEIDWPKPIEWKSERDSINKKTGFFPIAGGGHTDLIRSQFGKIRGSGSGDGNHPIIDGFIEYSDPTGRHYVSGFCLIFARRQFHTAWIVRDPELYNYRFKRQKCFWPHRIFTGRRCATSTA